MDKDESPPCSLPLQAVKEMDPASLGHPKKLSAMDDAHDPSLLESDEKSRRLMASVDEFIRRSELQGKLELAAPGMKGAALVDQVESLQKQLSDAMTRVHDLEVRLTAARNTAREYKRARAQERENTRTMQARLEEAERLASALCMEFEELRSIAAEMDKGQMKEKVVHRRVRTGSAKFEVLRSLVAGSEDEQMQEGSPNSLQEESGRGTLLRSRSVGQQTASQQIDKWFGMQTHNVGGEASRQTDSGVTQDASQQTDGDEEVIVLARPHHDESARIADAVQQINGTFVNEDELRDETIQVQESAGRESILLKEGERLRSDLEDAIATIACRDEMLIRFGTENERMSAEIVRLQSELLAALWQAETLGGTKDSFQNAEKVGIVDPKTQYETHPPGAQCTSHTMEQPSLRVCSEVATPASQMSESCHIERSQLVVHLPTWTQHSVRDDVAHCSALIIVYLRTKLLLTRSWAAWCRTSQMAQRTIIAHEPESTECLSVQKRRVAEVVELSASKDAKILQMESESRMHQKKIRQLQELLRINESPSEVAQQHAMLLGSEETPIPRKTSLKDETQLETIHLHAMINEAAASKQLLAEEMQREQVQLQARMYEAGAIIVDLQTALSAMQGRFLQQVHQLLKIRSARAPLQAWRSATVRRAGLFLTETRVVASSHKRLCMSLFQRWRRWLVLHRRVQLIGRRCRLSALLHAFGKWRMIATASRRRHHTRTLLERAASRHAARARLNQWRHRVHVCRALRELGLVRECATMRAAFAQMRQTILRRKGSASNDWSQKIESVMRTEGDHVQGSQLTVSTQTEKNDSPRRRACDVEDLASRPILDDRASRAESFPQTESGNRHDDQNPLLEGPMHGHDSHAEDSEISTMDSWAQSEEGFEERRKVPVTDISVQTDQNKSNCVEISRLEGATQTEQSHKLGIVEGPAQKEQSRKLDRKLLIVESSMQTLLSPLESFECDPIPLATNNSASMDRLQKQLADMKLWEHQRELHEHELASQKEIVDQQHAEIQNLHAMLDVANRQLAVLLDCEEALIASKEALRSGMQQETDRLKMTHQNSMTQLLQERDQLSSQLNASLASGSDVGFQNEQPQAAQEPSTLEVDESHCSLSHFLESRSFLRHSSRPILAQSFFTWSSACLKEPACRSTLDASRSVIITRAERMFVSLVLQAWRRKIRTSAVAALFRGRHRGLLVAFLFRYWMMETGFARRLRHAYRFLMRRTLRLLVSKVLRLWCLQASSGRTFKDVLNATWTQQECGTQNVLNRLRHTLLRANRRLARSACKEWRALTASAKVLRRTVAHGGARLLNTIVCGFASNHLRAWRLLVSVRLRRARQGILVCFDAWLGTVKLTLADKLMQRIAAFGGARLRNRILSQAQLDHFRAWKLFVTVGWRRDQCRTMLRFFVEWAVQAKLCLSQRILVCRAAAYAGARLRKRIRLAVACYHIRTWRNFVCLTRQRVRLRTLARCFDAWGSQTLRGFGGRKGLGGQGCAAQLQIRFDMLMRCEDFVLNRIRNLLRACFSALRQNACARQKRKAACQYASRRTIHHLHMLLCAWADAAHAKMLQARRENALHLRIKRRCKAVAFLAWSCSARADVIARSAASFKKSRDKPMEVLDAGQRMVEASASPTQASDPQVFEAWAQDDSIDLIGKRILSEIIMWRESQAEEERAIAAKLAALR